MEQACSILWAVSWIISTVVLFVQIISKGEFYYPVFWSGTYLSFVCIVQFFVAMFIDRRYDPKILKYYLWAIWYPTFYWYFNALVVLRAIPKALLRKETGKFAVWESPDRGLGA
jgi:biofilm PGA synthesis N-glycosyltransferase PgaC